MPEEIQQEEFPAKEKPAKGSIAESVRDLQVEVEALKARLSLLERHLGHSGYPVRGDQE